MSRIFKIILLLIVSISSLFAINCGDYGGEFQKLWKSLLCNNG